MDFFLAKLQGCEKCGAAVTKSMWNSQYKTKKMKPENFQNSKNDWIENLTKTKTSIPCKTRHNSIFGFRCCCNLKLLLSIIIVIYCSNNVLLNYVCSLFHLCRWRPYRVEYTGSLLTSEVKRRRARLVLGWGTAWEDLRVLSAFPTFTFRLPTIYLQLICTITPTIVGNSNVKILSKSTRSWNLCVKITKSIGKS